MVSHYITRYVPVHEVSHVKTMSMICCCEVPNVLCHVTINALDSETSIVTSRVHVYAVNVRLQFAIHSLYRVVHHTQHNQRVGSKRQ